ncbi:MAG: hypothetical protein IV100_32985 [Myxococcales bacterium]|nr:hypothetical protein [Myxococcales bacterium]
MRRLLSSFLLSLPLSCTSGSEAPPESSPVQFVAPNGTAITDYVAVITALDGTVAATRCGDGGSLLCGDGALKVPLGALNVRIKAVGFAYADLAPGAQSVTLEPLELATTADFRTGFGVDDRAAFESMAYPASGELGRALAVKFFIRGLDGEPDVYFQDTRKHPIHYDFAHSVLGVPGTAGQFAKETYSDQPRRQMGGTLILYPDLDATITLEFFPSDTLTPAQALRAHALLEERLGFVPRHSTTGRLHYVPAGSAQEAAMDAAAQQDFERAGAPWATLRSLFGDVELQAMNPGVAYGTLVAVTPEQLLQGPDRVLVSSTDIVLLSRLPNDLPLVAGCITEELQTPLAHVNVAAHARGTPNLALPGAGTDPRVAPFLGKLVRFEVAPGAFTLAEATLSEAQAFWETQARPEFIPTHDDDRDGLLDFVDIGFADSDVVGVKAANLAELSALLGDRAPTGFAVPFRHYDRFMTDNVVTTARCTAAHSDCTEEGRSVAICDAAAALCEASATAGSSFWGHAERLLADSALPTDTALREAALDGLVHVIGHGTVDPTFATSLDAHVAALVGDTKVRLRSSTNAEDLPDFSGAGLYVSHSATASGDKAASLRIREVWASVWRWRAFEERRFWNIRHRDVRMGIAVHRSFPDEAANGVLITQNVTNPLVAGMTVNVQKGEVSVTNPEGGEVAEAFTIVPSPTGGVQVARQRWSTLSPDAPVMTDAEITALYQAAYQVQLHFASLYAEDPATFALDLEFKLDGPERRLTIKQVRPYASR